MSDLIGFLEARIAEDEAAEARKWRISVERMNEDFGECSVGHIGTDEVIIRGPMINGQGVAIGMDADEFRAKYTQPAPDQRILAECAAKRVIIAECREDHEDSLTRNDDTEELATVVLRCMAAVYSTHAEYRKEWGDQ